MEVAGELPGIGGADGVREDGDLPAAALPDVVQHLLGEAAVHDDGRGTPEQGVVLLQKVHAELLQHPHIRHGQGHLAVGVVDGEVGGGALALQDQEVGDVDAGGHALPADLLAVDIVPGDGDHLDAGPQAGGILTDVVGDAAHRHADEARVGVLHHQGFPAAAHEVDVHRADAHHIALRGLGEDVALAQDVALLGKIRDVDRHGGAGDARLLRQLLLGDAGILPDPVQDLLFPLGHGQTPFPKISKCLTLIYRLRCLL